MKKFLRKLISWASGRYFPDTMFYGHALKGMESERNSKIFMSLVTCFPNSLNKVERMKNPADQLFLKANPVHQDLKGVKYE